MKIASIINSVSQVTSDAVDVLSHPAKCVKHEVKKAYAFYKIISS